MRGLVRKVLETVGHQVIEAGDGRVGMEMALEFQPQLMIVDWVMPEMNGLELTRALRQTKIGRSIYILIMTGLEDDDRLIEAFENGVDDFMNKPINPRVLAARLRAGQRVIRLQQELDRDREEIRRFAAELAVSNRRLQEVALTDSLTGFPNRRYAIERIQQEWSVSSRTRRPLPIVARSRRRWARRSTRGTNCSSWSSTWTSSRPTTIRMATMLAMLFCGRWLCR